MENFDFLEVKAVCSNCGKEVKLITYRDSDLSEYLCPKCTFGEAYFDQDSDF